MIKILTYGQVPNSEIFARVTPAVNVEQIVTEIIANVRANGDKALLEYNEKFDKARLDTLLVSQEEIEEAFASVEPRFLEILEQAAENIRAFHSRQVRNSFV
ncbi:MAG: histidinol dehydrogenase, partial [Oscillospiraceae bacterium]|nr:histidinol dehydrogenase [Oscillospiraceae bacterium]